MFSDLERHGVVPLVKWDTALFIINWRYVCTMDVAYYPLYTCPVCNDVPAASLCSVSSLMLGNCRIQYREFSIYCIYDEMYSCTGWWRTSLIHSLPTSYSNWRSRCSLLQAVTVRPGLRSCRGSWPRWLTFTMSSLYSYELSTKHWIFLFPCVGIHICSRGLS